MLQVTSSAVPSAPAWVLATARLLFTLLSVTDLTRGLLASAPGRLRVTLRVHFSGLPRPQTRVAGPRAGGCGALLLFLGGLGAGVGTAWASPMNGSQGRWHPQRPAWDCPPAPPGPPQVAAPLWLASCFVEISAFHNCTGVSQGAVSHWQGSGCPLCP